MGMRTRPRTSETWANATARTAGPDTPPVPPPSHGVPARCGCGAMPRSVSISETASAPWASAAAATSAGDAQLGVNLTISGFAVRARTASSRRASSPGSAPNIKPVLTLGHETLSSSAVTSSRSPTVRPARATSSWAPPITLTISGTGSSASSGQVVAQEAVQSLVGQPDRVEQSAGSSYSRGARVSFARRERDRLGHDAANGNRSSSASPNARCAAIASNVPGRVDDRVAEVQERTHECVTPFQQCCIEHRAVHAQPYVAARGRDDAAEAGAVPHAIPDSSASCAGTAVLRADRTHGFEHRGRAAGVDLDVPGPRPSLGPAAGR